MQSGEMACLFPRFSENMYLLAANLVLLLHLAFICLVAVGGLIAMRFPRFAFIHIPSAIWGFLVEAFGWYCPLTELETTFLRRAAETGYESGFLGHYLMAAIYPAGLTRQTQIFLAAALVGLNVGLYGLMLYRRTQRGARS